MQLNDLSVPWRSSDCSNSAGRRASVNTKDSMVAMSGAIMPEPLAMPAMVTGLPPMEVSPVAALGQVSGVKMAAAASSHNRHIVWQGKCGSVRVDVGGGSTITHK